MHAISILAVSAALLTHAFAAVETWDGGADNQVSTGANWLDNTAPVSDLINTDLIFAGTVRLTPNFGVAFSADSVTFSNTAGAFTLAGAALTVGAGGIANNDGNKQTFANPVVIGANSAFAATAGALEFAAVGLGQNTLTVTGTHATSIAALTAGVASTLNKTGAGTLHVGTMPSSAFTLNVHGGAVQTGFGGVAATLGQNSAINVNAGALHIGENLALNGGHVELAAGTAFTVASGRTVTVSNQGGIESEADNFTISAGATFELAAGALLRKNSANGKFTFGAGATVKLSDGAGIAVSGLWEIGASGGSGRLWVTGSETGLFHGSGGVAHWGRDGGSAQVVVDQGATAALQTLALGGGDVAGTSGSMFVRNGAAATIGTLTLEPCNLSGASLTVEGSGAAVTMVGSFGNVAIGRADISNDGPATIFVKSGGRFDAATRPVNVRPNGTISVAGAGSSFEARSAVAISGGQLLVSHGGKFLLGPGGTLALTAGASALFGGADHSFANGGNYTLVGPGTVLTNSGGAFVFGGDTTITLGAGTQLHAAGGLDLAATGAVTLSATGTGAQVGAGIGSTSRWGRTGAAATVTISGGASGSFGAVELGNGTQFGTAGLLSILGGSQLTAQLLTLGAAGGAGVGTVALDGAGSKLIVAGPGGVTVGAASGAESTLSLQSGTTLSVPAAETRIRATGALLAPAGTLHLARLAVEGGTASIGAIDALQPVGSGEVAVSAGGKLEFGAGFFSLVPIAFRVAGSGSAIASPSKLHFLASSSLAVEAGGDVTAGSIDLGSSLGPGSLSADGIGSNITVSGASQWGFNGGNASAAFSNGAQGVFATVSLPSANAGAAGTLSIASGGDVKMAALSVATGSNGADSGIVTIAGPGSSLTITNALTGLTVGGTSATVGRLTLADSAMLSAAAAKVNATGVLTVDGGFASFSAFSMNAGTMNFRAGSLAFTGALTATNTATGTMLIGDALTLGVPLVNAAGGRIALTGANGVIAGGGSIQNSGLISGAGAIEVPVQNLTGGEIRAESGKTLTFSALSGANAGRLNLQGGALEFGATVTNAASGEINGRGTLHFAAGLANQGQINLSGGFTDVSGSIAQSGAGKVIVSGGATATFYGALTHNGAEWRTSAGARSVFFGAVNGAGPFTGAGETFFEAGYLPGNSPAVVALSTHAVFTSSNTLTMEIGGLAPGPGAGNIDDGHDKLLFTNAGNPMVTWGGTLAIDFINGFVPQPGQAFDLFDFDPARDAGAFTAIDVLDPLPAGTALDFSQLYATGQVLVVVPEPSTGSLLLLGAPLVWRRRRR